MSARQPLSLGRRPRLGLAERLLFRAARALSVGSLEIHLPGHRPMLFCGPEAGPAGVLIIHRRRLFTRLLTRGDLGFAEAYMAGEWDSPDLSALLACLDRNLDRFDRLQRGRPLLRWLQGLHQRLVLRNNRAGSRRNIAYHYDLGNDFYRLWLDPSMTYSCARYESGREDLEQAQMAKYDRLLALTGATPEDHILEIGCGWGGFAIRAAQTLGCRVTGVTLSRAQLAWARKSAQAAGVDDRVSFRLQDYRDIAEQYDHIVSIEMFEAVGEAYWSTYFNSLRDRLRPGGRAVLQIITIDDAHFEAYRQDVDFIRRYIFPGGVLPSPGALNACYRQSGLKTVTADYCGQDYARTLSDWGRRFQAVERPIRAQGFDDRFIRMWRYYLAYCQAGFSSGRINLLQTVLEHE